MLAVTFMVTTPQGIQKICLLTLHNDGTGTEERASYDVEVVVENRVTARCRIEDYDRELGPIWLTKLAIEKLHSQKEKGKDDQTTLGE